MRLDKFLTECGLGSRSVVKKLLKSRLIRVNEVVTDSPKHKLDIENDVVFYQGEELKYNKHRYYLLYKKAGYITATKDKYHKTVMDLLPKSVNKKGLFPVGRLDIDTEGLLLLTNDGNLAHELLSPNKHVTKVYLATLANRVSEADIIKLEKGVDIGNYLTKPCKAYIIEDNLVELHITEGKFHQVKRMFKSIGNEVKYLKRVRMGNLTLAGLERGQVREIKIQEIKSPII